MIEKDDTFPAFELQDQSGKLWTNEDLKGKRSVVFFFPKADTPG